MAPSTATTDDNRARSNKEGQGNVISQTQNEQGGDDAQTIEMSTLVEKSMEGSEAKKQAPEVSDS